MRKIGKLICTAVLLTCVFMLGCLLADHQALQNDLVRLHVVANSNSAQDQKNKLVVRDAVLSYLQNNAADIKTAQEAKAYLQNNLNELEKTVNQSLASIGASYLGKVTLVKEKFSKREYDTFSLPSGIYNSLRIELGKANGKNWWCVAFPSLCMPKTKAEFRGTAIEAGIQETLVDTISDEDYQIRFFLLDCLGKIENFFHFG